MKLNSISMKSEQSVSWSLKRENQRHDCATPPRNYQKKNVYLCHSKMMQPHANGDAVALCSSLFSAAPSTWGFPEWKSCFLKTAPQLFLQRPSPSAWNLPVFTSSCACITFNDQILTCEGKFLHLVIPVGLSRCYCHQHEVFSWLRYAVCHAGPRGESSDSYSTLSLKRSRTTPKTDWFCFCHFLPGISEQTLPKQPAWWRDLNKQVVLSEGYRSRSSSGNHCMSKSLI